MQICLKLSFHAACTGKKKLADFSATKLHMHLCASLGPEITFGVQLLCTRENHHH